MCTKRSRESKRWHVRVEPVLVEVEHVPLDVVRARTGSRLKDVASDAKDERVLLQTSDTTSEQTCRGTRVDMMSQSGATSRGPSANEPAPLREREEDSPAPTRKRRHVEETMK